MCVCFAHVTTLHISPSSSDVSCIFVCSVSTFSSWVNLTGLRYLTSYRAFPAPKSRGKRTPTSVTKSLATWPSPTTSQVMSPNTNDKMITADDDATPINDPDHDSISDFSKTTHINTGWFGVPTVCETSVSQIFRGDLVLQRESKESLTRETQGKQRMREDRDGSVISVAESMSKTSRRNSVRSHSHQTQREFYAGERDLREHLERRAQQAVHGEYSVRRKVTFD